MNEHAAQLVQSYRSRGILIDTNLLLLLFIGSYDPRLIATFKRTMQFTQEDFHLIVALLAAFEHRVTTPHILTEISNLAGQLPENNRRDFSAAYRQLLAHLFEIRSPASDIVLLPSFARYGLTDAAIEIVARGRFLVLTDDLRLTAHLERESMAVLNYNHIRTLAWR